MTLIKPIYFAFFIVAFVATNSFLSVDIVSAEESTEDSAGAAAELKAAEIEEKLNRTVESIELIQAVQSQQVAAEFGISMTEIEKRLLNLGKLKTSYQRLQTSITDLKKLEKDRLSIKQRYEDYHAKGMAKRPPYTLTFLDTVFEELSAAERQQQNIQLTMEMLRQEIVEHNEGLKNAEKELRKSQERLEAAAESKKKMLRWEVDENNVQKEYFQAIIQAKNNEIQRYQLEKDLTALQIALLKEQTAFIGENVAYAEEDLKQRLETLQQQKAEIQSENEQLRDEQEDIEEKWLKAQQNVEKQQTGDQRAIAAAYLEAREEWRKTYQIALELNEKAMLLMDRQIMAWNNRYALVKGDLAVDRLKEMKEEIETGVNGIGQILQIQQNYLINLQKQMSSVEGRIGEERIPEAIQRHLSSQLDALGKQLDRGLKYQTIILAVDEVEKRLLDEIEKKLGQITIEDHLAGIKENIVDFWNIEIWSVDNKSVTLRKVATALVILAIGMIVAKFILAMIRSRFLLKSQFKDTTASAVHKILSYAAYLLVFLFALRMVNIPLTAFAFLGGAIAIGVGFGAQNLLNNFISGFMILGERPINIGDLIEIDGVVGMVEEIGARCTRVRTGENIHILVPNSAFLERNIINWTLSDKKIRTHITIGVSYGSPVKKVEQKLIEAVNQVQQVLKHPEPFVLFIDFGDNALIFNLYFWIAIKRVIERRQIESEVRFIIDEIFAEEGIIIAFPQRDVHLDTDKPLKITVTD